MELLSEIVEQYTLLFLYRSKKQGGEGYKGSFYLAAQAEFSCYLAKDLERPECNLFQNADFQRSNAVLDGILKQRKAEGGEPFVDDKETIHWNDLPKLAIYFEKSAQGRQRSKTYPVLLVQPVFSFWFARCRGAN